MTTPQAKDKFATADLTALRSDLLQMGVDSFQAAELVSAFLSGRGYGVSQEEALHAVGKMESDHCSLHSMQSELERIALVM